MKYIVSLSPDADAARQPDMWCPGDEPVIPAFPAPPIGAFLSAKSFKLAQYARVIDADVMGIDVDTVFADLVKQYPGLPPKLIQNYVVMTALAVKELPLDTKLGILITAQEAKLRIINDKLDKIDDMPQLITIWSTQPM
jgi:hypothetical protein